MPISSRIKDAMQNASWIRRMFEEGERLKKEVGAENVFDLSIGNPLLEPPEGLRKKMFDLLRNPEPRMHAYMPNAGYPFVRQKVAEFYTKETGIQFAAEHIVMTCGAAGGLNVVLKTLLEPGDEVLIFAPYFPEYLFYVDNHGGKAVVVKTNEDFSLNIVRVEEALSDKTKVVIVNSPNNPTGVLYGHYHMQALAEVLNEHQRKTDKVVYLVNDAAYRKIVYDGRRSTYAFSFYKNSIEVTSHSKDLGLAGERIGHIAVSPQACDVEALINGFTFCNRTLGFVNAPALMQRAVADFQFVSIDVQEYQKRRDLLFEALCEMGYQMVKPEGAFYLFPATPEEDDVAFVRKLQKKRVLVTPGIGFGTPSHFRISYAVPMQVLERAISVFDEVAREYGL
ncbi:MAG: pyridoxal phosphate-dependent aminotransferase [Planctomycetota bacterium]|nr:pyridoxal phosphate-dependent aminotransferase [Planctomycetota bacterium]